MEIVAVKGMLGPMDFGFIDSLSIPMSGHRTQERKLARSSKLRPLAKKRDGDLCGCCNLPGADEMHHIHPICFGGDDSLENVIMLCALCHKYAPNNGDEFLLYQKRGGMYPERVVQAVYRVVAFLREANDDLAAEHWESFLVKLKLLICNNDVDGLQDLLSCFRASENYGYFPYPHVAKDRDQWVADGLKVAPKEAKEMLLESIRLQIRVIRWVACLYPELPRIPVTPKSRKALDSQDFLADWFSRWNQPVDEVLRLKLESLIPENIVKMFFNVQYAIDTIFEINSMDPAFVDTPLVPLLDHYCKTGCMESALKAVGH